MPHHRPWIPDVDHQGQTDLFPLVGPTHTTQASSEHGSQLSVATWEVTLA